MLPAPPTCPEKPWRLTVVVENTAPKGSGLVAEHGLALWLETEGAAVLFDTGASGQALARNAQRLGVPLARAGAVVLSHGHGDHTGGLAMALAAAPEAIVWHGPGCLGERWARRWGVTKAIGIPAPSRKAAEAATRREAAAPVVLPEGLMLSGPVPGSPAAAQRGFLAAPPSRPSPGSSSSEPSPRGRVPDPFRDELFALLRTPDGWALITGCCHRGLENTLRHARQLTGGAPVAVVVGGLHLARLPRREWDAAAAAIEAAGTRYVLAGHCTGERALAYLASHTKARVEPLHAGLTCPGFARRE